MPSICRRNSDVPLHLRSTLAGLENWPQTRLLKNSAEFCCMVGEAGDTGIEAKASLMCSADSSLTIAVAFSQKGIDTKVPKGGQQPSEKQEIAPDFRKHECPDELIRFQSRPPSTHRPQGRTVQLDPKINSKRRAGRN